jgi:hypothetical protein
MTFWQTPQWKAYERAYGSPISRVDELAAADWQTHVVDLTKPEDELWRNLRRSYKALIHKVDREYKVIASCPSDSVEWFRRMHLAVSGRRTRPDETWDLMASWVDARRLLVVASGNLTNGTEPPGFNGFAGFLIHGTWSYYGYAATTVPNVNHALVWVAMLMLKANGITELELGWQGQATDDKGKAIEFFRRGFGGRNLPANFLAQREAAL